MDPLLLSVELEDEVVGATTVPFSEALLESVQDPDDEVETTEEVFTHGEVVDISSVTGKAELSVEPDVALGTVPVVTTEMTRVLFLVRVIVKAGAISPVVEVINDDVFVTSVEDALDVNAPDVGVNEPFPNVDQISDDEEPGGGR
jgi:hypothetical protein